MDEMDCARFAEVTEELALGVLTGRERAAALAHLDGCLACGERVRRLMMKGEDLLGLLPGRDPPAGFETRVLERLGLAALGGEPAPGNRLRDPPADQPAGQPGRVRHDTWLVLVQRRLRRLGRLRPGQR